MSFPRWVALVAAALLLPAAGCAARRLPAPSGVRVPAPDGMSAWEAATAACRGVRVYSATVRLSGRVDRERVPAGLSVAAGLDDAGGLRLEARMVGRRVFTLAGTPDRVVLLLHREREFAVDRADRVLEALVGTKLEPADLLAILTGCATSDRAPLETFAVGKFTEVVTSRGPVYLEQSSGGWRPRLAFTAGLQVDFRVFEGRWPREIAVWTTGEASRAAELRFRIESVEVNSFTLSAEALEVDVPSGFAQVELDAVRQAVSRKGVDD